MRSWPRVGLFALLFATPALAQLPPTATPGFRAEGVFYFARASTRTMHAIQIEEVA